MVRTPEEVLEFWFGQPATTEDELMAKVKRWFMGGPEMDRDVRERFEETVDAALEGRLDGWANTTRSLLALVLVLDQFTRNVFRNDPKTYEGDAKAQALVVDALDRGLDTELDLLEAMFLRMPLVHAENLELQRRSTALANAVAATAPPLYARMCAMNTEQTVKYTNVIARFGRFPHRNAILGRTTTPEEAEFLKDWAAKGPPAGMRA